MKRILMTVEGETEETFVNHVIRPHLIQAGYHNVSARLMGNARARSRRGGIRPWNSVRGDILRHLHEDGGRLVTLMVDYYGLPDSWPGRTSARTLPHPDKPLAIESAIVNDIRLEIGDDLISQRFVPLIMMHEFEAMLFSDCKKFADAIGKPIEAQLQAILNQFGDPEMINDSPITAPSKRILSLVPSYQKPLYGNIIALDIGLDVIRQSCKHFGDWIAILEGRAS